MRDGEVAAVVGAAGPLEVYGVDAEEDEQRREECQEAHGDSVLQTELEA